MNQNLLEEIEVQFAEETDEQETKQFQFNLRSWTGLVIEFFTNLTTKIENFFAWPEKRRLRIEAEAEENFRLYSAKTENIEV